MGRKIIEIPKENEGFQRSWGEVHGAVPLNLSLDWPSVWGGKSLKFLRKMKDSRGPGGGAHYSMCSLIGFVMEVDVLCK